jgi:AraC family transcriptional regulator
MARLEPLFGSSLVTIVRVEHSQYPAGGQGSEDVSLYDSINFVEHGHFELTLRRKNWIVHGQDIFVTTPGMEYRSREIDDPDRLAPGVCLDVRFSEVACEMVGPSLAALRACAPVMTMTNRRAYLQRRLSVHLEGARDELALDLIAGELLQSAGPQPSGERLYRPALLYWYARRIDDARLTLDRDYAANHSLDRLARSVGMSPYHFARIFRELAGVPPHRYLLRRRLAEAVERLRQGASVTATCYDVGFRSVSHFAHAFRAAYQMTPLQCRSGLRLPGSRPDVTTARRGRRA